MTKITLLFVFVAISCCVNAQVPPPFPNLNGVFSMLNMPGGVPFNFPNLSPEYIKNTPGNGQFMSMTSTVDKDGKVNRDTKLIINQDRKVQEYSWQT